MANFPDAMNAAVARYEVSFATLVPLILEMRANDYWERVIGGFGGNASNMDEQYMSLAHMFSEWVIGLKTIVLILKDPKRSTKFQLVCYQGSQSLCEYTKRVAKALNSL